jgi:hypothetical protein
MGHEDRGPSFETRARALLKDEVGELDHRAVPFDAGAQHLVDRHDARRHN